jgi:hypothetical protein
MEPSQNPFAMLAARLRQEAQTLILTAFQSSEAMAEARAKEDAAQRIEQLIQAGMQAA